MRRRRRARELVLKALYSSHMRGVDAVDILLDTALFGEEKLPEKEILDFSGRLLHMYGSKSQVTQKIISGLSKNWLLSRIAVIDRIIIEMGLVEILYMPDIPKNVTINEMIDLAKKYSTEKSGQFVNGLLDNVLMEGEGGLPREKLSG